ncbi:MAG TPA: formylmethanofuran dehydrogenase subunit B, partial [Planctomycetaceae bacterium]|nr:formylmethanofuran dehydrogenase subunit B [Planctomycetaceae bacterium]
EWFRQAGQPAAAAPAEIDGQPVALTDAIQRSAELLRSAKLPLFFGLSRSSTDGQRAVCELADQLGGIIDTTASLGHGPSIVAFQSAGESTSTLGEVRHRSDLIIYWGCDPLRTHPRHMQRLVDAAGLAVPDGRAGRHVVVVDSQRTATADRADQFLQAEAGSDLEIFSALRLLLTGRQLRSSHVGGLPQDVLKQLAERMKAARYGAVFFGVSIAQGRCGHATVEALLRLVTDLNQWTRFVVRRMRVPGDVTGADSVLCWQTGFPFSVSLTRRFPRYGPGEYSAENLLAAGEPDCVVLVGGERVPRFSAAARRHLDQVPVILLDPAFAEVHVRPAVRFRTAVYGIHRRGTAYRMDEVPIPLRQLLPSDLPSDDEILRAVRTHLDRL